MKFCPKCGTLMQPRRINGINYLVCPKCGYKEEVSSSQPTYKVANKIKHTVREKSIVIENDKIPETLPKLKDAVYCPKCGHNEVYYWTMQTRAADEPPTRFYKCAKCGHVWREYE
ncbi:MAG: transcription factor S [Fervidicoccaceae archaeon]|jgi:DNA-directed RNA polymerase subunit M